MNWGDIFFISYIIFTYCVVSCTIILTGKLKPNIYNLPLIPAFILLSICNLIGFLFKTDKAQTIHNFCKTPFSEMITFRIKLEKK